mmetsp:Transcript_58537/g.188085  ORF Transcript_58537/g.188085 Transcript_58537/m.188085 type:complete len:290 (-) Transcript_58537:811-1680(-)
MVVAALVVDHPRVRAGVVDLPVRNGQLLGRDGLLCARARARGLRRRAVQAGWPLPTGDVAGATDAGPVRRGVAIPFPRARVDLVAGPIRGCAALLPVADPRPLVGQVLLADLSRLLLEAPLRLLTAPLLLHEHAVAVAHRRQHRLLLRVVRRRVAPAPPAKRQLRAPVVQATHTVGTLAVAAAFLQALRQERGRALELLLFAPLSELRTLQELQDTFAVSPRSHSRAVYEAAEAECSKLVVQRLLGGSPHLLGGSSNDVPLRVEDARPDVGHVEDLLEGGPIPGVLVQH